MSARSWWIIIALVLFFNIVFYYSRLGTGTSQGAQDSISYTTFVAQVRANHIANAKIAGTTAQGDFNKPYRDPSKHSTYTRYKVTIPSELYSRVAPLLESHKVQTTFTTQGTSAWLTVLSLLLQALPFLLLLGLFWVGGQAARQQQAGIFGFGRSRAKVYTEERPSTTFADVAGVESAKRELVEIVDFLREPDKYHRLGARTPKGVLLVGPPGTGKTLLARAVAGEAGVPFFSISAPEFVEMFVGVGASRVRDLFDQARKNQPSIIFIDELDAIGSRRSGRASIGTNDEREQTLNQLLVSMDGFEPNEAVIVLAATNRPDVLDPALLRPGRFDRQISVDLPDRRGREAILKIHTRSIPLAPDVDLVQLAQATPGMTGADLANLANEAALTAARRSESQVTRADFDQALDRITLGIEGPAIMDEDERRTVAYHESGHTLVALILPKVDPVHRVTITPRGRSLGVTQFRPIDDRRNYPRDYLLNRLAVGLGGRAAEEIACNQITSGAENDLRQVTGLARTMVMQLGMADELGPAYFGRPGEDALDGSGTYAPWEARDYSDETAERIDKAVLRLVNEAHDRAVSVLKENREALDALAETLVREESLDREELTRIVNEHRGPGQKPLPVPKGEPTPVGEVTEQLR